MFKVGDIVKYTGNSPVFSKHKMYKVETSNSEFFSVENSCFNQENTHWTLVDAIKVGDWIVSRSGKGVEQYKGYLPFGQLLTKVNLDKHPHKEVMLAYAAGKKVEYYSEAVGGEWIESNSPSFYLTDRYRVKPKFKVGDWVQYAGAYRLIKNLSETLDIAYFKGDLGRHCLKDYKLMTKAPKHWVAMELWSQGAWIDTKCGDSPWIPISDPGWYDEQEYRVRPIVKVGDWVYYFGDPKYVIGIVGNSCTFLGYSSSGNASYCTKITSHEHMTLMNAWANGAKIEVYQQGWQLTTLPVWDKDNSYRLAQTTIKYQVAHGGKFHDIRVTFVDNKITAISAD